MNETLKEYLTQLPAEERVLVIQKIVEQYIEQEEQRQNDGEGSGTPKGILG